MEFPVWNSVIWAYFLAYLSILEITLSRTNSQNWDIFPSPFLLSNITHKCDHVELPVHAVCMHPSLLLFLEKEKLLADIKWRHKKIDWLCSEPWNEPCRGWETELKRNEFKFHTCCSGFHLDCQPWRFPLPIRKIWSSTFPFRRTRFQQGRTRTVLLPPTRGLTNPWEGKKRIT